MVITLSMIPHQRCVAAHLPRHQIGYGRTGRRGEKQQDGSGLLKPSARPTRSPTSDSISTAPTIAMMVGPRSSLPNGAREAVVREQQEINQTLERIPDTVAGKSMRSNPDPNGVRVKIGSSAARGGIMPFLGRWRQARRERPAEYRRRPSCRRARPGAAATGRHRARCGSRPGSIAARPTTIAEGAPALLH